jgi:hypothetical protein
MPQILPENWAAAYDAAVRLACCVPLAAKDRLLPEAARAEAARSYTKRAVGLLRQAVQRGFTNVKGLQRVPEFGLLRADPDFRQLLKDLEGKAPAERRPRR